MWLWWIKGNASSAILDLCAHCCQVRDHCSLNGGNLLKLWSCENFFPQNAHRAQYKAKGKKWKSYTKGSCGFTIYPVKHTSTASNIPTICSPIYNKSVVRKTAAQRNPEGRYQRLTRQLNLDYASCYFFLQFLFSPCVLSTLSHKLMNLIWRCGLHNPWNYIDLE